MILADIFNDPVGTVFFLICIVIAVTVHEFAHAKASDNLGDPTAQTLGRITLNPLAHLDLLGSIFFLFFGFGWGKPVPYDPYNLKNPRRDSATIALAGPLSNFIMAIGAGLLLRVIGAESFTATAFATFLSTFVWTNLILGIFNFIPIAPLDGFRIVGGLLPENQADEWQSLERYGFLLLIFFILPLTGGRSMLQTFISPIISVIAGVLIP